MTQLTNEVVTDPNHDHLSQALDTQDSELEKLRQQRDALTVQIEIKEKAKRDEVLKLVKQACKHYGFTHQMLKGALAAGRNRQRT